MQEVLEEKMSRLFNTERIVLQGSSRTDAGVHALGMSVSFEAPESPYIPDFKICKALNRLLPPDIRINRVNYAPEGFNARFCSKGKAYIYVINTADGNPFTGRYSHLQKDFVHVDAVREGMKILEGTHQTPSFSALVRSYL